MFLLSRIPAWMVIAALAVPLYQAQTPTSSSPPVELAISGPKILHRGDKLWFSATLTNRSGATIAVPSPSSKLFWWYTLEVGWEITDKRGRRLASKQAGEVRFDNMIGMPTFHDSDFVLLKAGEKIEYNHDNLGDPSDLFLFPGNGLYYISLTWHFCTPTEKPLPNNATAYTCGIAQALSPSIKEILLATPSFHVRSNVWDVNLK